MRGTEHDGGEGDPSSDLGTLFHGRLFYSLIIYKHSLAIFLINQSIVLNYPSIIIE